MSDTDTLYGRVSAVFLRYAGSSLATAIAGGETTVQLEDVFDYNDAGGQALVFADDTPNAAEVLTYTGVDRDTAQLTGVTWATGGAHAAGAFVSNDPDGAAFDTWAVVSREGFDDGDMVARVPHRWQDAVGLAEGIYDQQSGVPVSCTFDGSQYVVTDVLGTQLAVDGSAIDGSTITGVTATVGTDGLTPDTPVVTLVEGPGWLQASWPLPNTTVDPLGFRVYIADGSDPTTVGSTNLVATTTALSAVISTLADGTTPLATADTYHVIVVAYSLLAGGGTSADSTAATGSPGVMDGNVTTITNLDAGKITTGTLAAARIAAGSITADRLAGTLTFSNVFQTSAPGTQRVVIDGTAVTGGIFLFDSSGNTLISLPLDPAMSATFKGNIQTGSITITGNLTIQGTTNIMDKGSQLTLNEKTGNANTPPTATLEYPTVALTGIPTGYTTVGGVNYDAAGGAGGATPVLYGLGFAAGSTKLMEFSASTGALLRSVDIGPGDDSGYGVTRAGTKIWVLELSGSGINSWVRVDQAAFTVDTTITASSLPNTGSSVTAIAFPPNGRGGLGVSYDGTHVLVAGWASATNGAAKTISRYDMSSGTPSHVDTQTLVNGTKLSTTSPRALTGLAYDGTNYWTVTSLFTSGGVPNGYIMEKYIVSTLTLSTGTGDTQNDRDFTQGQDSGLTNIPLGLGYDSANGIFYLGYGSSTGSTTSQVIKMTSWLPTGNLLWVAYAWKIADTVVDTVTISNASPAVITVATVSAHGLSANDEVFLTTTGTLPTGLSPNTPYYVQSAGLTTTAFRVAATKGGSSINTSSAGSGTHTLHKVIETLVSPQTSVNLTDSAANTAYRRRVRITTPTIPSGFDHSPVYALINASQPSTTSLQAQTVASGVLSQDSASPMLLSGINAGQAPRATSNTVGATSTITATAASWAKPWILRGDGTFVFPSAAHGALPSTPEVQVLTMTGSPTGGTWGTSFTSPGPNGGLTTTITSISRTVSASALATLLNAMNSILDSGGVACSGGPINSAPITVTWLQGGQKPLLVNTSALTGGTAPVVTTTESVAGLPMTGQVVYDSVASAPATWDGVAWRYDALDDWAMGGEGLREALFVMAGVQRSFKAQNLSIEGIANAISQKSGVSMQSGRREYHAIYWPGGLFTGYVFVVTISGNYTDSAGASGMQLMGGSSATPVVSGTTTLTVISGSTVSGTGFWKGGPDMIQHAIGTPFYLPAGIYYIAALYLATAVVVPPDLLGMVGATAAPQGDIYNFAGVMAPTGFPFHAILAGQTTQASTTESIAGLNTSVTVGPFWMGMY